MKLTQWVQATKKQNKTIVSMSKHTRITVIQGISSAYAYNATKACKSKTRIINSIPDKVF